MDIESAPASEVPSQNPLSRDSIPVDSTVTDALDPTLEVFKRPLNGSSRIFTSTSDRNKALIDRYKEGLRLKDIAIEFGISEVRVSQIIKSNHALIAIDKEMEKVRRFRRMKQCELRGLKTISPRTSHDLVEILNAQRAELEGESATQSQSTVINNTQVIVTGVENQSQLWEFTRKLLG